MKTSYERLEIRQSKAAFNIINRIGSPFGGTSLYLYLLRSIPRGRKIILNEIVPPIDSFFRWYRCEGTDYYWRFNYEELVFDACVQGICLLNYTIINNKRSLFNEGEIDYV